MFTNLKWVRNRPDKEEEGQGEDLKKKGKRTWEADQERKKTTTRCQIERKKDFHIL